MSATTAGTLAAKAAVAGGAGVLGALAIAAVNPPATRREMFLHALAAGIGSLTFGPLVVRALAHYVTVLNPPTIEVAVPIYFVVGALSWGVFSMIAQVRAFIAQRGAAIIIKKTTGE